jgi:hypothetical protein
MSSFDVRVKRFRNWLNNWLNYRFARRQKQIVLGFLAFCLGVLLYKFVVELTVEEITIPKIDRPNVLCSMATIRNKTYKPLLNLWLNKIIGF